MGVDVSSRENSRVLSTDAPKSWRAQGRMFMKIWTALAILLVLAFGMPHVTKAQDLATILGTVTDSSGSVVPDAQVTVSNDERGFTRKVTSDEAGAYAVARIPIGNYAITVEKAGFEKLVRKGIHAGSGANAAAGFAVASRLGDGTSGNFSEPHGGGDGNRGHIACGDQFAGERTEPGGAGTLPTWPR